MKKMAIFLYGLFLLLFSIFSYAFVDPNLSYLKNIYSGFAFSNRVLTASFYGISVIIFFIFYGFFIWLGIKKKLQLRGVLTLVVITAGALLFSYPAMLSYDIFNYIATSKVLFFYHENPYIVMPIEFVDDPILAFTHAANKIALYALFWISLTGIPYVLGFGNFIVTLFSFKVFIVMFYLATTILIWKISKNILPVILFSLNPLVVVETLISGHNDIVMVFLVLFSFFLLANKKIFLGLLFFILSIFIKYATILLIPILLLIVWKVTKNKGVDWMRVYFLSSLTMLTAFFLSPIREEIYPWYAIWFLPFIFFTIDKKFLINISIFLSLGLLLRYVPYIFTGTYMGHTPILKEIISFGFPAAYGLFYVFKKKI